MQRLLTLLQLSALSLLAPQVLSAQIPDLDMPAPQLEPAKASTQSSHLLSPWEIDLYRNAPTLIDWSLRQIQESPVLRGLQAPTTQTLLTMVLDRAGKTASDAFTDFPKISCDESVVSEAYQGIQIRTRKQKFRYIVIPRPVGDFRVLQEYRTDLKGGPPDELKLGSLFMVTWGFASNWLYLSPAGQADGHFRYFGSQTIRGRECHVVGFAQDPERARTAVEFSILGKGQGHILVQGFAWIDTQTFQILRVMTWMLASRLDLDLSSQVSTVDFDAVHPSGSERALWLPRDVKVWAVYGNGSGVRNTHHYSDFKLFRVDSTIKPLAQ